MANFRIEDMFSGGDGNQVLSTGGYVQNANGFWIPQTGTDDGAAHVRTKGNTVKGYYEGDGYFSGTYTEEMTGISIINDGMDTLTFVIHNVTRTVYPEESYSATLPPFTQVEVNATSAFRLEVLN